MATQNDVTDHKLGTMNIKEQEKTFAGFIRMAKWVTIIALAVVVFLALSNA